MSARRVLMLLMSLATMTSLAHAREYVVSQKNPAASDGSPGTRQKPFKTISAAAVRVQAGDKVIIHAGEYRETVIINTSGTAEAPITFEAAPAEVAVIKGSDVLKNWSRDSGEVWKAFLPPIIKKSADSKDTSFWRTNDVRLVIWKDGLLLDAGHLRRVIAKDQLRAGAFFCDLEKEQLFVWLPDSSDPNTKSMEVGLRGAWLYVNGSNIVIRGLQMRHSSTSGIANWPACALKGDNVTVESCTISWSDFVGISLNGNNDKLLHSTVACHGDAAIGGTGKGNVISRCRVLYNNIGRFDFVWHCGGAKLIPSFCDGQVTHNEFAYNMGPGLWLDGGCNDNLLEGNLCHDNEGAGIIVEACARNRVFNNICYANRNPGESDYLTPDLEATKRGEKNYFHPQRRAATWLLQPLYHAGEARGIYISSSPDTKVFHNTCYLNEAEGICVEGPLRAGDGVSWSSHGTAVVNNISVYNKGTQLVVPRNGRDKDTYDNRSDYNMLLALGAVLAQAGWDGTFIRTLKDWQQQSGQDEHSIQTEPMFAMGAMGDFRLLPDSPGAKTGQPTEEVRDDFFGSARAANSVSIGACEVATLDYPRPAALYLETSTALGNSLRSGQ